MAKVWQVIWGNAPAAEASKPRDWRRAMSNHIAYALLVYTGLQISITMNAFKSSGGSLLPYFALIILVVAIIPACRSFEQRWNRLSDEQAIDPSFACFYRRDRMLVWLMAIGLPFIITGVFMALAMVVS